MGTIKRGKMQAEEEEEGVQQGDKIKSSCGNGGLHERKEKRIISKSRNPSDIFGLPGLLLEAHLLWCWCGVTYQLTV